MSSSPEVDKDNVDLDDDVVDVDHDEQDQGQERKKLEVKAASASDKLKPQKKVPVNKVAVDLTQDQDEMPKHGSGLFYRLPRVNGNGRYRCVTCDRELYASGLEGHIKSHHPLLLSKFLSAKQSGVSQITDHFSKKTDDDVDANVVPNVDFDVLRKKLARFLVTERMPLSTVNSTAFRDLLTTVKNFASTANSDELRKFKVPDRRTVIEDDIEGPNGILKEAVEGALARLEGPSKSYGSSLLFDGAKDANGQSLEVFMIQSGSHQALLFDAIPHEESKDTDWMVSNIKGLVSGRMDFTKMMVLAEGDQSIEVDGEVAAAVASSSSSAAASSSARVKRQKAVANSHLKRLFTLMDYLVAVGGDNAKVPVKAALRLEKEIGVIPFGCAGHAFSRSFQHICDLPEFKENVIEKASQVVDLFLSRAQVRGLLRSECDKSVYRLIPTRFVSAAAMVERLIELQSDLIRVVDSKKFQEFRNDSTAEVKRQCDAAKDILRDDRFWEWCAFFLRVSVGYIVAVRCMDGAKAGSVCLVYKMWSMLSATVEAAFVETKNRAIASKELFDKVKKVICKDWKKFHFPVYSAGYLLTPHFHAEFRAMRAAERDVFAELVEDTVGCCLAYFRRFDEKGTLRSEPLRVDDIAVSDLKSRLTAEIEAYIALEGCFKAAHFAESQLKSRSPSRWWDFVGSRAQGSKGLLYRAAMRITSISPSTTPVERLHKIHKSNRTKSRNLLGYARALGLNFICCEHLMSQLPNDRQLDWQHLMHYGDRFTSLSGLDKDFLATIQKEDADRAQAQAEADEEQLQIEDNDAKGISQDQQRSDEEDSDEEGSGEPDDRQGAPVATEPTRSSRGRVIRMKLFEGFV